MFRSWLFRFFLTSGVVALAAYLSFAQKPSQMSALAIIEYKYGASFQRNFAVPSNPIVALRIHGNFPVDDAALHEIVSLLLKMPDLQSLRIDKGNDITSAGLHELTKLNQLHELCLECSSINREGLKKLAQLSELRVLGLWCANIDQMGLNELRALKKLDELVCEFPLTSMGMKALGSLTQLRKLWLRSRLTSPTDVSELAKLALLEDLRLPSVDFAKVSLKKLGNLKKLVRLDLWDSRNLKDGLKDIALLDQLKWLDLGNSDLDDKEMGNLGQLTNLQILSLYSTNVTDQSIMGIANLKNLQFVELTLTDISSAGVKQLQKALPKCSIRHALSKEMILPP